MKDMLYKLYGNPNFAVGLFIVIAVLLVLFVIVLLAAMKDTKQRKLEELDKLEKEDIENIENKTFGEQVSDFEAKKEEVKEDNTLSFFEDEEEISKTRDIVFDAPMNDNSMSDLLNEFDEEPKEEKVETDPIQDLIDEANRENEQVFDSKVEEVNSTISPDFFDLTQIDAIEAIKEEPEMVIEKTEEVVEKEEEPTLPVIEKNDEIEEDFELPAIKKEIEDNSGDDISDLFKEEEVPDVSLSDIKKEDINLEETGILDFSSIESESYEIK